MEDEKKTTDYIKKFTDSEHSIKRIPFYMFLICVLLVVLIFEIRNTNNSLRIIAENGTQSVEYDTVYDTFVEIVTEETKELEDYIPIASENSTSTTNNAVNNNGETTTKTSSTVTTKHSTTSTTTVGTTVIADNNNQGKQNYILVTSTKKIHSTDCTYASKAKPENKKSVTLTDDQLNEYINNGYVLCKSCGGK